jgi:hypothetical protein
MMSVAYVVVTVLLLAALVCLASGATLLALDRRQHGGRW